MRHNLHYDRNMTKDDHKAGGQHPSQPPADQSAEIAQLRKDLTALQAELEKFKDLAARSQADLQNAKARVDREGEEMRKFAGEVIIRKILPTLDNFQRAFQHVPQELQSHEWVKGVGAIEQDLMKQMAHAGLKRMQSLGEIVDPHRHEVLSIGPGKADSVAEVFEEGYELHGKILRPAKIRAGDGSS